MVTDCWTLSNVIDHGMFDHGIPWLTMVAERQMAREYYEPVETVSYHGRP